MALAAAIGIDGPVTVTSAAVHGAAWSAAGTAVASKGGPSPRPPPQPLQATANPPDCHIDPYGPGGCDRARQPVFAVVSTQRSGTHFLAQQLVATGAVCKPAQTSGRGPLYQCLHLVRPPAEVLLSLA